MNRMAVGQIESLFLWEGGRFAPAMERLGLARQGRVRAGRAAALVAALAWLPLFALAAIERVAWGSRVEVPLLWDFLPYAQFLVAVPVLLAGDEVVGRRLGRAMAELQRSGILGPEDTPALTGLTTRAAALWRGPRASVLILVLTVAAAGLTYWGADDWLTGSWQLAGDRLTAAGWWYLVVSESVLRFLTLQWVWRFLLWAWMLWRISQLKWEAQPSHPDRAGGLAFLGATQAAFAVLVFALSVQLSSLVADSVYHQGADLWAYRAHVTIFVLIMVSLLLLPLVPFAPRLVRSRSEALLLLSGWGSWGARHLEGRLRLSPPGALPADDVSALSDFGALYEHARRMKPLPFDVRHAAVIAAAALVPFLPLVFLVMPAPDVLSALRGLLL